MVITEFLERNARLYGSDTALVELNPSQERDSAVTWREASLIESAVCQSALKPWDGAGDEGGHFNDELSGMAADLLRHPEGGRRGCTHEFPLFG